MSILEQLRAKQLESGQVATPDTDNGETEYIASLQPGERGLRDDEARIRGIPSGERPFIPPTIFKRSTAHLGYLRLLPPTVQSLRDVTPEWQAEFWAPGVPSAWQRVEGEADHPDFEKNLAAFE